MEVSLSKTMLWWICHVWRIAHKICLVEKFRVEFRLDPCVEMLVSSRNYRFADTEAAQMLAAAIHRYTQRSSGGLRALAEKLEMKQAAVLSHMANGRMAIPLERAPQLATALDMNVGQFTKAVLKQRFPGAMAVLDGEGQGRPELSAGQYAIQLAAEVGGSEALTPDRLRIISEVVRDRKPEERWLAISEVAIVRLIRELRPAGLDHVDLRQLREALEGHAPNAVDYP